MDDDTDRANSARRGSPYLTAKQAAFFLGLSPRSLQRMRAKGDGPIVRRHARMVLYHIDDLKSWSQTRADQRAQGAES